MSKRNLESRIESLEEQRDDVDQPEVEFNMSHVMSRERAERENREILGPAENAAEGIDAVKVPIDQ